VAAAACPATPRARPRAPRAPGAGPAAPRRAAAPSPDRDLVDEVGVLALPDARHLAQLLDAREPPVLGAPVDDPLREAPVRCPAGRPAPPRWRCSGRPDRRRRLVQRPAPTPAAGRRRPGPARRRRACARGSAVRRRRPRRHHPRRGRRRPRDCPQAAARARDVRPCRRRRRPPRPAVPSARPRRRAAACRSPHGRDDDLLRAAEEHGPAGDERREQRGDDHCRRPAATGVEATVPDGRQEVIGALVGIVVGVLLLALHRWRDPPRRRRTEQPEHPVSRLRRRGLGPRTQAHRPDARQHDRRPLLCRGPLWTGPSTWGRHPDRPLAGPQRRPEAPGCAVRAYKAAGPGTVSVRQRRRGGAGRLLARSDVCRPEGLRYGPTSRRPPRRRGAGPGP
jgi:hypothetical protein